MNSLVVFILDPVRRLKKRVEPTLIYRDEFQFFEEALKTNTRLFSIELGHDVFRNKVRAKGPHQGELVNKSTTAKDA